MWMVSGMMGDKRTMDGRNLARAPKRLHKPFIVMKQITHDILARVFSGLQSFNTCCAQADIYSGNATDFIGLPHT
jgi:hypothetical protein